jgi:hypothetical protein
MSIPSFLFIHSIYGLFNDAVSSSDYTVSNNDDNVAPGA